MAHTEQQAVTLKHLTEEEKNIVKELAWFSLDAIKNSDAVIYLVVLPEYLSDGIEGKYPQSVLELDLG